MDSIIIYTDGACSGNPGPGGWAAIVYSSNENRVLEISGSRSETTNNKMELQAVIEALQKVENKKYSSIVIYTDSTYVIKGITQWIWGWKRKNWLNAEGLPVANQNLWQLLDKLVNSIKVKIDWKYVRGHRGTLGNERCDVLAVNAAKGIKSDLFEGPLEKYLFDMTTPPPVEDLPEFNKQKMDAHKTKQESYYLSLINGEVFRDTDWKQCEGRVKGRPGVKFKKIKNSSEEVDVLISWGVKA